MSEPRFSRRRAPSERGAPWMAALAAGSLVAIAIYAVVAGPAQTFRGHTGIGLTFGVLALVLGLASAAYSYRKRAGPGGLAGQGLTGRGTMAAWLWFHLLTGGLAATFALLHAGGGALTPQISTGWLLGLCFGGLIASGIAWRLVYHRLPTQLQPRLRNYSLKSSRERIARHEIEIEKRSAGRSEGFHACKREAMAGGVDPLTLPAADRLSVEERAALREIADLIRRRQTHAERLPVQERATWLLQGWRWLHVPLALGFLIALPAHIVGALGVGAEVAPSIGSAHADSATCGECHEQITKDWQDSMHGHALSSPVTIVQNNVAVRETLPPEYADVCVNCHGPLATQLDGGVELPFEGAALSSYDAFHGVGCVDCHQLELQRKPEGSATLWTGRPDPGVLEYGLSAIAGLDVFRETLYDPGWVYYGNNDDPVGNSYHDSEFREWYADDPDGCCESAEMCASCHNVHLDLDGDGRAVKGQDLVLQTLIQEWEDYRSEGGFSCPECHMPRTSQPSVTGDTPLFGVDGEAAQGVRSHLFVGADYPLDAAFEDTHRPEREALMRAAVELEIDNLRRSSRGVEFDAVIRSVRVGHNMPSGFAFARQIWIEVIATDASGNAVFTSGLLPDDATSDLCDADTMSDDLGRFVQDCAAPDPQLVNLQAILLDDVEGTDQIDALGNVVLARAPGAKEVPVQYPTSGPITRKRGGVGETLTPIPPGGEGRYAYVIPFDGEVTVDLRLRFRNLPPYWLRGLNDRRQPGDGPDLEPLISNLQVVDMAEARASVR